MDSDDEFFTLRKRSKQSKSGIKKKKKKERRISPDFDADLKNDASFDVFSNFNPMVVKASTIPSELDSPLVQAPNSAKVKAHSSEISGILEEIEEVELTAQQQKQTPENHHPHTKESAVSVIRAYDIDEPDLVSMNSQLKSLESKILKVEANLHQENENSKTIYNIQVISKLPESEGKSVGFLLPGTRRFQKIYVKALEHFAGIVDPGYHHYYKIENVVLVWKHKIRIHEFMKPNFLGIKPKNPNDQVFVTFYIMTTQMADQEIGTSSKVEEKELSDDDDKDVVELNDMSDYEVELGDADKTEEVDLENHEIEETKEDANIITLILRDKEQTKLSIKVTPQTQLQKVADYYKTKKGVTGAVRLVFDDENLDLNDTVENTELEDEFVIDVV